MPKSAKHLFIGSTEAHSGKSTVILAIAAQLQAQGLQVGWGKPLASSDNVGNAPDCLDTDLNFIPDVLGLPLEYRHPTLLCLGKTTLTDQLVAGDPSDLTAALTQYWKPKTQGDVILLEGPETLDEGALVKLSLPEMVTALDASVLLVMRFNTRHMIDHLVAAQQRLGTALVGVVINGVIEAEQALVSKTVVPYLESRGIPVLATLPQIPFLQGIQVSELVRQLEAEVLCCADHLDLMVESLKIGAMNVNAALRFFGQGVHQAVVTGGDRRDLQIAALETSTHCLILTGQIPPSADVIALATDKEVPILSVASDTLTTVEMIDTLFGCVPLNNTSKVPLVKEQLAQRFDIQRLMALLELEVPAIAP